MRLGIPIGLLALMVASCTTDVADVVPDAASADIGTVDIGTVDIGTVDIGTVDIGTVDIGTVDIGTVETGGSDTSAAPPDVVISGTGHTLACSEGEVAVQSPGDVRSPDGPGRNHASSCGLLVWATPAGGLSARDLTDSDGEVLVLVAAGANARWPSLLDTTVVFSAGTPAQVMTYDLSTGSAAVLDPGPGRQLRPRISAGRVAWEDERSGLAQARSLDRSTGDVVDLDPTSADQRFVALRGDDVVWTDFREDEDGRYDETGYDAADLHGLLGGVATPIVRAPFKQAFAEVAGEQIVWLDWRNYPHDEAGYPRPEPKFAFFDIRGGLLGQSELQETFHLGQVAQGTLDGLPTLTGGAVAWASGKAHNVHVLAAQFAPDQVGVDLTVGFDVADTPLLLDTHLVFRAGEALEVVGLDPLDAALPPAP